MRITRLAIERPVATGMAALAACVLGLIALARLGVDQMPDTNAPTVTIDVRWPDAAPSVVERAIAKPLEDELDGIAGVRSIRSSSYEGDCTTIVEFAQDADMAVAVQQVRERVAAAQSGFDRAVLPAVVSRAEGENASPVAVLALTARDRSLRELSLVAQQQVRRRLGLADGVARIAVSGLAVREVRVDLDVDRLRATGLTPAGVSAALARYNVDQPVGALDDDVRSALVRVDGHVARSDGFAGVIVARDRVGGVVAVRDVARVAEALQEPASIARVDGRPAVVFEIFRQQEASVVRTGRAVQAVVDALRPQLPPGVELVTLRAGSDFVERSLHALERTLLEGAVLAALVVLVFLGSWRSTAITLLTLPVSMLAAFVALAALGYTLNVVTLLSLSLCIGLVIDDAIVVRENIVRHVGLGESHAAAARSGTAEIASAALAATLALCAMFLPLVFLEGPVRRMVLPFGATVAAGAIVSLVVSFTLDPMLSAVWPGRRRAAAPGLLRDAARIADGLVAWLQRAYERLVLWTLHGARLPLLPGRAGRRATLSPSAAVLLGCGAALALAGALASRIGTEPFPRTDRDELALWLELPVGASLHRVDDKVREVEAFLATLPEVRAVDAQVGGDNGRNAAHVTVALWPRSQRRRTDWAVEGAIRDRLRSLPGLAVTAGAQFVSVAILGPDPTVLDDIAAALRVRLVAIPGLSDVQVSALAGTPSFAVRLEPASIRALGLDPRSLSADLRAYVQGDVATWWTTPDGEQVPVRVGLPRAARRDPAQVERLPVAYDRDGAPIALGQVAAIEPEDSPQVVRRQQLQRRQVVYGSVDARFGRTVGDVDADMRRAMAAMALPAGYRFEIAGAARDNAQMLEGLGALAALGFVFLYAVLASLFASLVQPLVVIASVPLSLVGATLALRVTGSSFNLFSLVGLLMLSGLATKNAILIVDFANRARREGASLAQALAAAGQIRMRPVVMTTLTMTAGMLPLALGLGDGGEMQAPMGRAIAGGLLAGTPLTLLAVPALYAAVARWRQPAVQPERPPLPTCAALAADAIDPAT